VLGFRELGDIISISGIINRPQISTPPDKIFCTPRPT
jgi:hypothetical protein